MIAVLVGVGGAIGAVLRYIVGTAVQAGAGPGFPWGTLVGQRRRVPGGWRRVGAGGSPGGPDAETRAFLVVGVLGGFTTFSAFANETAHAARSGAAAMAFLNVLASVTLCLAAVWAGRGLVAWWGR